MKKMEEYMKNMDYLTLFIVYDSEKNRSQTVFENVFMPIIKETHELVKIFAFDCSDRGIIN
jgi:hypothetical protein